MTRRLLPIALVSVFLAAGCATDDPHKRAKTGAAVGAVAGVVVGSQSKSSKGKVVGAAIGALTGAAVGHYMDRQQRSLEEELASERASSEITLTRIDDETMKLDVSSEATFDVNSARIRESFEVSLGKVAAIVDEFDQTAVHVIGHTDNTGSESYNQQLSEQRAGSVGRFLGREGVSQSRLRMSGRGELEPIADNRHKAGRSQNRRVEIYLRTMVDGREDEAFWPPA